MLDETIASRHLTDALARVLYRAIEESHRYESGLPHVLVCTDRVTGEATFSGPFCSLDAAERVAAHERRSAGADSTLSFRASPLYPPLDLASSPAAATSRTGSSSPTLVEIDPLPRPRVISFQPLPIEL